MNLVIDAYNLLKQRGPGGTINEQQRTQFIQELMQYGTIKGHVLTIVFDGGFDRRVSHTYKNNATIVYTGHELSADAYIKDYLAYKRARDMLVVSSDRQVVMWAYEAGVPSIDSAAFYALVRSALTQKDIREAIVPDRLVKLNKDTVPEVDELMRLDMLVPSGAKVDEHEPISLRQSPARRLSKTEKKLLQKIKKL